MASRLLTDLRDDVSAAAQTVLSAIHSEGGDLLIYCTLRTNEEQARLYCQGRPLEHVQRKAEELDTQWNRPDLCDLLLRSWREDHSPSVTNAAPGQSAHNYGMAFDAVPLMGGKPQWGNATAEQRQMWQRYGEQVRAAGLEWAGDWQSLTEYPHAQAKGFDWRDWIREAR